MELSPEIENWNWELKLNRKIVVCENSCVVTKTYKIRKVTFDFQKQKKNEKIRMNSVKLIHVTSLFMSIFFSLEIFW